VLGQLAGAPGLDLKTVALTQVAEKVTEAVPEQAKAAVGALGELGGMGGGLGQLGGGTKL
jgi:hypothetical protein